MSRLFPSFCCGAYEPDLLDITFSPFRIAAFILSAAPRYAQMMVLIGVMFFARGATAQDIPSLSIPIIVQFSSTGAPASPGFADALSREVGVTLSYSQPTSEGEQVFLVNGLFEGFPLSHIVQRLQHRADVISVTADSTSGGSDSALISVKFSASVADPGQPDFVWALSKDAGVTLAYLFEKTRGIQAFRVNGLSQPAQLAFILQRLKTRKDVLSAEANR